MEHTHGETIKRVEGILELSVAVGWRRQSKRRDILSVFVNYGPLITFAWRDPEGIFVFTMRDLERAFTWRGLGEIFVRTTGFLWQLIELLGLVGGDWTLDGSPVG